MKNDDLYDLIVKELSSNATAEEQKELEQQLSGDQEFQSIFQSIKTFWVNFFPKNQTNTIISKTEKKLDFTYHNNSKSKLKYILKLVASVLIIVSLGYSGYHLLKPKNNVELKEYSCTAGEIKEITLSDGTKVWLNSMSLLMATEPFAEEQREVKLYGEAYFEVAPDAEKPFVVKTQLLNTIVLGTHFNVEAYPTNDVHEIALFEGKVQLNTEKNVDKKIILNPGERAYFTTKTEKINVVKTDLGKPAKWRDGILRFYDEDLFGITKKLERKFQKRILITDSVVGNLKYTAEFKEESLDRILGLLSKAQAFSYKITNNGVIIETLTQ